MQFQEIIIVISNPKVIYKFLKLLFLIFTDYFGNLLVDSKSLFFSKLLLCVTTFFKVTMQYKRLKMPFDHILCNTSNHLVGVASQLCERARNYIAFIHYFFEATVVIYNNV